MTINATAAILLALYEAVARRQGVDPATLRGTVQNDILKEYIARGTYIFPPEPSMRLVTDTFAYCRAELPAWNTISISGYHMREAGATAVQEVAFTIADAIAYAEAALAAGLAFDDFAPRLSFFFAAHNDLFEEVAKFRAARARSGRASPASGSARATRAAWRCASTSRPAAHAHRPAAGDERGPHHRAGAWRRSSAARRACTPTRSTRRSACRPRRRRGSRCARSRCWPTSPASSAPVDPLGGSYYVEALTDEIEERVQAELAEIERRGGTLAALGRGYQQAAIADAAYEAQRAIETGERIVVGRQRLRRGRRRAAAAGRRSIDPAAEARAGGAHAGGAGRRATRPGGRGDRGARSGGGRDGERRCRASAPASRRRSPWARSATRCGGVWGEHRP